MLFPVTAQQLDLRLFGLTVNGQYMAHALYPLMAPVSRTMASITSCFISRSSDATLTLISSWWFRPDRSRPAPFGQTVLSQQDDRLQTVGQALEVLFLFIVENHGNFFISQGVERGVFYPPLAPLILITLVVF